MKKHILIFISILTMSTAFSQREMNMYFMENVMQSSYINPSAIPEHKFSIGWSGYTDILHPSFNINNLHDGSQWLVDDVVNNKLKNRNLIGASNYVDLLSIRFKAGNSFISFTNILKSDASFTYPGDLFRLMWNGNDSQETFDFSGLGFKTTLYTEHGIGATFKNQKWTYGGKIKLYNGIANSKLKMNDFSLRFKDGELDNYDALVNADMTLSIAGFPEQIDLDSLIEGELYSTSGEKLDDDYFDGYSPSAFKNFGLGIDLGATYHFNDKLDIYASVTDLGYIRWKHEVNEYKTSYNFGFDGLDFELLQLLNDSTGTYTDSIADALQDSLSDSFSYNGKASSYITAPIIRMYIGAKYQLFERTSINALFNLSINQGVRTAFSLGVHQEIGRFFSLTVTNTAQYGQFLNVGFGLMVKPGPFQIFFAADNISSLLRYQSNYADSFSELINKYGDEDNPVIVPHRLNQVNLRIGVNLVFGRNKEQESLQGIVE